MGQVNNKIARLVASFIVARHYGDIRTAKRTQACLKKLLKGAYTKTLLMHGNPDCDGYESVLSMWEHEARA